MIILAIDPGIATTGFGVIESNADLVIQRDYGCIRTAADLAPAQRLHKIYQEIEELIDTHQPSEMVVETLFFNVNVDTAMSVGQAKGVAMLTAAKRNIPVFEYTPLQVKQAVAGYGRAEKKQIQEMVKMILKLSVLPKPDDAADALALAICHANSRKMDSLTGQRRSWSK